MEKENPVVVFRLDEQRFALALSTVEKIVRIVEITPLPKSPDIVLGIVNVVGRVIPVFDIRRRFRLPARAIVLSDLLIIAKTSRRAIALVADEVGEVVERPDAAVTRPEDILPDMEYVDGVMRLENELVLIHDLNTFLSLDEEKALDSALIEKDTES